MDDIVPAGVGPVFRLIYRSSCALPRERREDALDVLFRQARRNNVGGGLSGALLVWRDTFVQLLEGDEPQVRAVFTRIRADDRHRDVVLLQADATRERVFARWSMARVGDEQGADVPLRQDRGRGCHPRPDPPLDDARQMTLDALRDYARPDVVAR